MCLPKDAEEEEELFNNKECFSVIIRQSHAGALKIFFKKATTSSGDIIMSGPVDIKVKNIKKAIAFLTGFCAKEYSLRWPCGLLLPEDGETVALEEGSVIHMAIMGIGGAGTKRRAQSAEEQEQARRETLDEYIMKLRHRIEKLRSSQSHDNPLISQTIIEIEQVVAHAMNGACVTKLVSDLSLAQVSDLHAKITSMKTLYHEMVIKHTSTFFMRTLQPITSMMEQVKTAQEALLIASDFIFSSEFLGTSGYDNQKFIKLLTDVCAPSSSSLHPPAVVAALVASLSLSLSLSLWFGHH